MADKYQQKELLCEEGDQYRQMVELSPVAIGACYDEEIVFVNPICSELFGAEDPAYVVGKSLFDFIRPTDRDIIRDRFRGITEEATENIALETKIVRADGVEVDVEIVANLFVYRNRRAVQFAFHEISKRKNVEELLSQSKQDWEETFHAITDMITVHDKDFNIIYANNTAQKMLKLPWVDANSLHKCFEYYHGTECPPDGCPSCNCLRTGESANFEIFEPHLNMYIEIRSMPRFDRNNQLIGLIHIARDVTDRKKAEKEIRKAKDELEKRVEERTHELKSINEKLEEEVAERRAAVEALQKGEKKYRNLSREFNALLNGIPDNLILLSPELKVMWANKATASSCGKDIEELTGQYCYSLCCNILSPCENCPTLVSFMTGKEETAEISKSDGQIWDIRAFPIKNSEGKVKSVIELGRDVTEKVNLQAGATRTRHLASLGELAAGVAHEINNPINNIINYAQILVDEFESEKRDDDVARRIIKDGDRIATIVRSLLSFARIRKEEKTLLYLHEIFSDTLSLTSAQIRKDGIHLNVNIPSKFLKVLVHPQQIQQVFLNIISNSRYALNQKYPGTDDDKILSITCEEIEIMEKYFVRIVFLDHGTGIPENIIDKAVNPFFSTKPNRIGTGLGLSISHGIITEHGGKLLIDSNDGEFTRVTIDLPAIVDRDE